MNSPQRAVPVRDRFYARTFALVTALVLGIALYKIVQPFFGPLLWAMFIAFLLNPLHIWLTHRLKGRAQLSAALLTVLTLIVLVGPLAALSGDDALPQPGGSCKEEPREPEHRFRRP